jgi:hypothetical protein
VKTPEFDRVVSEAHAREKETLCAKAGDYSREGDRLSNFKKAAALQTCTPEKALMGMLSKHLVSVADLVNDLERGTDTPIAVWREKLGDSRAYLTLLEGLIRERYPHTSK